MPTETNDSSLSVLSNISGMGAEAGFEPDEISTPFRFSGIVSLILGLLSWTVIVGVAAAPVAIGAIIFGLIALRPSRDGTPAGLVPARIGIILGVFFGLCGATLPLLKTYTLGSQADHFARRYIDVINAGRDVYAAELNKDYRNRFESSMPLEDYYESLEQPEGGQEPPAGSAANDLIRTEGPDATWLIDRPIRVYHQYHIDKAEVVYRSKVSGAKLQFFMECLIDSNDVAQWHVATVQPYRELIIAESVLD